MSFSGKYKGIVKSRNISKSPKGAIQFCVKMELSKKDIDGKYQTITKDSNESYEVWGNLTLLNCDGSVNGVQLRSLKQSLNWDGVSLKALNSIDIIGKEFPVAISISDQGKSRIDFINSEGPAVDFLDATDADWQAKNSASYG